jgi:hypothetical protein
MNHGCLITRLTGLTGYWSCRFGAVALLLVATTGSPAAFGQVEDLGSQAQGIVDQMHAQANYWMPARQSAMGDSSVQTSVTPSVPTVSPATLRQQQLQIQRQEQQLQILQQRQQMMMAGAQFVGQQIGQALGQALFGSNNGQNSQLEAEQARQAEAIRQQQIAAEHQARIERAAELRSVWDQRDANLSNELADVLTTPGPKSTAFFGLGGGADPSAVLNDPASGAGPDPFDSAGPVAVPDAGGAGDSSAVVLDDPSGTPALSPEFLAAQQQRAADTAAYEMSLSSWQRTSLVAAPPSPTGPDWRGPLAEKIESYGISRAIAEVKGSSAYTNLTKSLEYLPGYGWMVKAKNAYDYASNLHGQFDALYHPLETQANRTLNVAMDGMSDATYALASPTTSGSAFLEDYNQRVEAQGGEYEKLDESLIKRRVGVGASYNNDRDAQSMIRSDEPSRIRAVGGDPNSYVRANIWQQQSPANLQEVGYP